MNKSILSQLQDGILDTPIDRAAPESEVHLLHQVGAIPMRALDRALTLLRAAGEQVTTDTVENIDPRFVLAHAWNNGRLEQAKRVISEGFEKDRSLLPGIHAVYTLELPPYYLIATGEPHDVVAARLLGKHEITANIRSYCNADTNRLSIEGKDVYFWAAEFDEWRQFGTESTQTIQILEALGVQSKQDRKPPQEVFFFRLTRSTHEYWDGIAAAE